MYFLAVCIVWGLLLVTYSFITLPSWLIVIAAPKASIPILLALNITDWWATKILVRISPEGIGVEANPVARFVMSLGPICEVLFKLVLMSMFLVWCALLQDAHLTLALISFLILVVLNNYLMYLYLKKQS